MPTSSVPSPPQVNIGEMANLSTPTAETIQTVDSSIVNPSTYFIGESNSPIFTNVSCVTIVIPRNGSVTITMNTEQPFVGDADPVPMVIAGAETQDTLYSISAAIFGGSKIQSINISSGAGGCYVAIL